MKKVHTQKTLKNPSNTSGAKKEKKPKSVSPGFRNPNQGRHRIASVANPRRNRTTEDKHVQFLVLDTASEAYPVDD